MASLNPYLHFNGNAEEAFNFYKSVFGGEFDAVMRFSDTPADISNPAAGEDGLLHISLPITNNSILMGSDRPKAFGPATMGDNSSISISAESREEADRLFNGLSEGGQVTMPMDNAFWGSYFGMLKDKFGVYWMVSFAQRG